MSVKRCIQFISDIHLELRNACDIDYATIIRRNADASMLILAGDIGCLRPDTLTPFLDYCCSIWPSVIHVAGNHEFYDKKHSRQHIVQRLREEASKRPNLHFLDRDIAVIDGQRYLGCTLWSMPKSSESLNDFHWISHSVNEKVRMPIVVKTAHDWHRQDLEWLKENVQSEDVVITHFMPLTTDDLIACGHKSLFQPSEWDQYYGNTDCYDLFERQPKIWISGHTHQRFKVLADGVTWACNPYGYPKEDTGEVEDQFDVLML